MKSISMNKNAGVGVTLQEASGMLDVWLVVITDRDLELDPAAVRIHIATPMEKDVVPIEEWKLNTLRIGNKVRLRKTVVPSGGTVSGYILFPNEKKREHVLVVVPIGNATLEFPFDFSMGSKQGK